MVVSAIEALRFASGFGGLLDGDWVRLKVAGSLKQEAGGERIAGEGLTIFHTSK